jgi:hypothetical protein
MEQNVFAIVQRSKYCSVNAPVCGIYIDEDKAFLECSKLNQTPKYSDAGYYFKVQATTLIS